MWIDMIRSGYTTDMRFFTDSPLTIPVLWYRAPPGAKVFPHYNRTSSRIWAQRPDMPDQIIGEVRGAPRPWNRGLAPPIWNGQNFIGRPQDFLFGVLLGPGGNVPVAWQWIATSCVCATGTSNHTSTWFEVGVGCSCCETEATVTADLVEVGDGCACAETESVVIASEIFVADGCACCETTATVVASGYSIVSSTSCVCAEEGAYPWQVFQSCVCAETTATHVP